MGDNCRIHLAMGVPPRILTRLVLNEIIMLMPLLLLVHRQRPRTSSRRSTNLPDQHQLPNGDRPVAQLPPLNSADAPPQHPVQNSFGYGRPPTIPMNYNYGRPPFMPLPNYGDFRRMQWAAMNPYNFLPFNQGYYDPPNLLSTAV